MTKRRRRAVNLDQSIIEELKCQALQIGEKTHTSLMKLILIGKEKPIGIVSLSNTTKGVSMPEEVYLAISARAKKHDTYITEMTRFIVTGTQKPLSEEEIESGIRLAIEKAEARKSLPKKYVKKKKSKDEDEDEFFSGVHFF